LVHDEAGGLHSCKMVTKRSTPAEVEALQEMMSFVRCPNGMSVILPVDDSAWIADVFGHPELARQNQAYDQGRRDKDPVLNCFESATNTRIAFQDPVVNVTSANTLGYLKQELVAARKAKGIHGNERPQLLFSWNPVGDMQVHVSWRTPHTARA